MNKELYLKITKIWSEKCKTSKSKLIKSGNYKYLDKSLCLTKYDHILYLLITKKNLKKAFSNWSVEKFDLEISHVKKLSIENNYYTMKIKNFYSLSEDEVVDFINVLKS